jgi:two-component system, chemotaxis family, protein-glutamate methylesterase/glutaminase
VRPAPANEPEPLRLVVADDSELFRSELADALTREHFVLDQASNGREALALCCQHEPDVVLLDLNMPVMDGLEAIREIMAQCPTPILVVSGVTHDVELTMEALASGALEVTTKPSALPIPAHELERLVERIRLLATVPVIRRRPSRHPMALNAPSHAPRSIALVVMVASTGGPSALARVLADLPPGFATPIVIVQHLEAPFGPSLVSWLDGVSPLDVRLAEQGDTPLPCSVLVVPPDKDAVVDRLGRLQLSAPHSPRERNTPSADKLLLSVARHPADRACGVVLTGMGSDGAAGLLALRKAGGLTIAQDGRTCVVDGMPRRARQCGAAQHVIAVGDIGAALGRLIAVRPDRPEGS